MAIRKTIWPERNEEMDDIIHEDRTWNKDYFFQRYVVEWDDKIVGYGEFMEPFWSYRPGKYAFGIDVLPAYRRHGIGSAFYDLMERDLAQRELAPTMLTAHCREDMTDGIHFLEKRGFKSVMRWPASTLELAKFDPAAYGPVLDGVERHGIRIVTLDQYKEEEPAWQQKLHALDSACVLDEPNPDTPTPLSLEDYVRFVFQSPSHWPEAFWVALDGDKAVGMTYLFRNRSNSPQLNTGFTGVLRSHRRRGIATALKVLTLTFAKQTGAQTVRTGNEENNPMFQINLRMGFEPAPAFLAFEKVLEDNQGKQKNAETERSQVDKSTGAQ